MGCYEVFGVPEEYQCSMKENTGALCVGPASPLHLLFPAPLCLCFYVRSHLHMMHWREQTTSCLNKYVDESAVSAKTASNWHLVG